MDLSRIINDDSPVPPPHPRKILKPKSPNRRLSPPSPPKRLSVDQVKPPEQEQPGSHRRRQKFDSPPIWAQKAPTRQPVDREAPRKDLPVNVSRTVAPRSEIVNSSTSRADIPRLKEISEALGHWEPSILNVLPHEEFTRVIADFLYQYVVGQNELGSENIEIEAKIGQIVDQNTQQRLQLPVHTETIIRKDDPRVRTSFQSSMTLAQHSAFNQYLNAALIASLQKKDEPLSTNSRNPLTYVHTKETDTMYQLTQAAELVLPSAMRRMLTPRYRRVRVTTDSKTGNEIGKMIKVRLADLDIYSPMTPFDWRISVNLESPYEGDYHELPELMEKGKKPPPRNKDRLTYRHQGYQIDLTQVTIAGEGQGEEKEHELEIELDTAIIRTQAELLRSGQTNGYEDVVRGFVDNVRLLTRSMKR